jgi:hypothetical protein
MAEEFCAGQANYVKARARDSGDLRSVLTGRDRDVLLSHKSEDRIFEFFLSDAFDAIMSVSPETVPDTRSEQFRRTVQRRAGNYRRR